MPQRTTFYLVLTSESGENAALPHGSGTDRALGKHDFTLIDTGGLLHSYGSDVTRTFALRETIIPPEHRLIWDSVRAAQNIAADAAHAGIDTGRVDEMALAYLGLVGYAQYFTHRLGHGPLTCKRPNYSTARLMDISFRDWLGNA